METTEIAIYATNEVARKFVLFQQYFEPFSLMVDKGVFTQRNAAITLHFDKDGVLKAIKRMDSLYDFREGLSTY